MKLFLLPFFAAATAGAAFPSVGPDYIRPDVATPAAYRDPVTGDAWQEAAPAAGVPRGAWWGVFYDPTLNRLEQQSASQNQDLRAAVARVEQAWAVAGLARSAAWPTLSADPAFVRERMSTTTGNPFPVAQTNDFLAPLQASWELDLFGRVRRLNESARADAAASAAALESVRLSVAANVAADYFAVRGFDREIAILRSTADLRRRELDLVAAQRRGGTATELDVSRAETELAAAEAETSAVGVERAALESALAVLVGEAAPSFVLAAATEEATVPLIPAGVPSALLQRRPDIAAAERAMAAANARIGVAQAAFFPAISLTGSAGYESADTARLFHADSRLWSLGPSLYLPLFQGGRNRANLERSRAAYDENVAAYRQQVLVGFREVQEALSASRLLAAQAEAQARALASSRRAAELARMRYQAGYVSFLDVVDAQRTELANERASARLVTQRLGTAVALIKSLGGGWSEPAGGAAL